MRRFGLVARMLTRQTKLIFTTLICLQIGHSIEEYTYRLYDKLPIAGFVSHQFSQDLRIGFLRANSLVVGIGLVSIVVVWRRHSHAAVGVAWFWAILESLNGIAHVTWSAMEREYRPGLATAPFLLICAVILASRLVSLPPHQQGTQDVPLSP